MFSWVIAASAGGFATSLLFAGVLQLSRNRFLIAYVVYGCILLYTFIALNDIDVAAIGSKNWVWGILAGVLACLFVVRNVKSQPTSRQTNGARLAGDLAWAGLVYGMVDALFLNVMPVVATWVGTAEFGWTATFLGKIGVGIIALLASLLVTLAYHLGYPEFRNKRIFQALVGNSVMTLAFLLSGSPLGSLISHPVMHISAVLQGAETTLQLPPHYQAESASQSSIN